MVLYIKNIDANFIEDVALIASECFADDEYFMKISHDRNERLKELYEIYKVGFQISLRSGEVFGAFINEKLVGFAMFLDYKKLKENVDDYNYIFPLDHNSENYDVKKFLDIVSSLNNPKYLLAICVSPNHQKKGIGYEMAKYFCEKYKNYEIISDVDNVKSLSIYKKLNFNITKLNDSYYYVNKNNKIKLKIEDKNNSNVL